MEEHSIPLTLETGETTQVARVKTRNVDWISVVVNGRPRRSYDTEAGGLVLPLSAVFGAASGAAHAVEIQGFQGHQLVAATRKAW